MRNQATEAGNLAARRRSRWPVVFGTLVLLWCAWWYCRGESQGLLMVAAGLAALAIGLPRSLPGNARWVIWTGLLVTVICLAANVPRLTPPAGAVGDARLWDRLITVTFALGLTALFFRLGANSVTAITLGGLPMVMIVLGRNPYEAGTVAGLEALIVWGYLVLTISLDQVQHVTRAHESGRLPRGARSTLWRLVVLAGVLVLAFALRPHIEQAARIIQKRLFGLVMQGRHERRGGDLSLMQLPPRDFGGRMRMVLLVRANSLPGYLRESVFTTYQSGRWAAAKPGLPLPALETGGTDVRRRVYALTPSSATGASAVWRVEVLSPQMLSGLCLPGRAVTLTCEGLPPLADTNGAVTANEVFPGRYEVAVVPHRLTESAYPCPDGAVDSAYGAVPAKLAGAVSNWVAGCEGLAEARTARAAVSRVEKYFATNFVYRLGVQMRAIPDPLVDFMERREGSCTLFASAAALMLRWCGMPTRVVGGYVCCGWNPWLDRWVVRERERHAWVEVWDAHEGRWLIADPTPPCGNPATWAKPDAIRMALDLLIAGWKRLIVGLKGANFLAVIAEAGEIAVRFLWHVVWSPAGMAVWVGFACVWWYRRRLCRRTYSEAERLRVELAAAMRGLERRAVSVRMRRRVSESWDEWLLRVGPELPAERFAALREQAEEYQELRYRAELDGPGARRWIARVRGAWPPRL
ncbi:MAG: transglutaminase-like domain-containing protein [bacterium]